MHTIPPARPGKQLPNDGSLPPCIVLLLLAAVVAAGVALEVLFP